MVLVLTACVPTRPPGRNQLILPAGEWGLFVGFQAELRSARNIFQQLESHRERVVARVPGSAIS